MIPILGGWWWAPSKWTGDGLQLKGGSMSCPCIDLVLPTTGSQAPTNPHAPPHPKAPPTAVTSLPLDGKLPIDKLTSHYIESGISAEGLL